MEPRDFSSISPSAQFILLVRAQTSIPFAREAAELMWGLEGIKAAKSEVLSATDHQHTVLHFENRYTSVDRLLADSGATCVLEIGAGLSFRGLAAAQRAGVFYLDTDLPEIVDLKRCLIARLPAPPLSGVFRLAALDALDRDAFHAAAESLPPGPMAIVNEGLLVYLDEREKRHLASTIRETLRARSGVWITGDVYVKGAPPGAPVRAERVRQFLERHRIEENKFDSWAAAERFFLEQGFSIAQKLSPSADPRHVRESWMLEV